MIWGLIIVWIIFLAGFLLSITVIGAIIGVPIMLMSGAVYFLYYGLGRGKCAVWQEW
jgi:hypothetical protein